MADEVVAARAVAEDFFERYERALSYFDAENYSAAARELASLVGEVPDDVALRLRFARALYHSAQLQRAEAQLR
nr:tetratricopeptide repeat protein [Micromonospora sp. DSM 115978]